MPSPWPDLGLPLAPPNPTAFTKATSCPQLALHRLHCRLCAATPQTKCYQRGGLGVSVWGGQPPPMDSIHRPQPNKNKIGTSTASILGRLPATTFNTAVWWLRGVSREGLGLSLYWPCATLNFKSPLYKRKLRTQEQVGLALQKHSVGLFRSDPPSSSPMSAVFRESLKGRFLQPLQEEHNPKDSFPRLTGLRFRLSVYTPTEFIASPSLASWSRPGGAPLCTTTTWLGPTRNTFHCAL